MGNKRAAFSDDLPVGIGKVDTMGKHGAVVDQTHTVKVFDRSHAVMLFTAILHLFSGFGGMDVTLKAVRFHH